MVQMLNSGTTNTFYHYAEQVFLSFVSVQERTALVLMLFGMYIKEIALGLQPDKRWHMSAETSCSLCCDSKDLERCLTRGQERDRTV